MDKKLPQRKRIRWEYRDYSDAGMYFITICIEGRKPILSKVLSVGDGALDVPNIELTEIGKIVERNLLSSNKINGITIDQYVIMPNHIHVILFYDENAAGASPRPTIMDVVCAYKSLTTRRCKEIKPIKKLFQTSFYDRVIRTEEEYYKINNTELYISNGLGTTLIPIRLFNNPSFSLYRLTKK